MKKLIFILLCVGIVNDILAQAVNIYGSSTTTGSNFVDKNGKIVITGMLNKNGEIINLVTDYDGNVYTTVTIGTQTWMVENLKVTHYRNGDPIPNVTDNTAWVTLTTGAYCSYNNLPDNFDIYGALYNWFTVADTRNIAPTGWHVPTEAEWTTLETFLGGQSIAGGKMKEPGTTHWRSPNVGATNESGFSALPSGIRADSNGYGAFYSLGDFWFGWSSTVYGTTYALRRNVGYNSTICDRFYEGKQSGYSVRLIKD
jgi:uncharacterized protein (TIGR02145 family)